MVSSRRARSALIAVLGAILLSGLVASPPADAAVSTGIANGAVKFPQKDNPKLKVLWFTKSWSYLGTKNANGGSYSLNLPAGSYHLQFVDQRATYETDKYAPSDIAVTVHSGRITTKNVTMQKGAFITGTVKAGGKVADKARVVAANQNESSFETTANSKGQFAIGGLPEGKYSLFSYDHKKTWVDKSAYAGKLKAGTSANVAINLKKKAGSLRVYLFTSANGTKKQVTGHPTVTAVSKKTGQFWSVKVKGGSAVFQGLYPGKYKLVANGFGIWFAQTAAVKGANVKAGGAAFGKFTYTKRGASVTGQLVDGGNPSYLLKKPFSSAAGAKIDLYAGNGSLLASGFAGDNGGFTVEGQISSQSHVTLVVTPGSDSGGYMRGEGYCLFDEAEVTSFSVRLGQETSVGTVPVPRHPDPQAAPVCATS